MGGGKSAFHFRAVLREGVYQPTVNRAVAADHRLEVTFVGSSEKLVGFAWFAADIRAELSESPLIEETGNKIPGRRRLIFELFTELY